jgi:hypothetical protein
LNATDAFLADLKDLSPDGLEAKRREIVTSANGNYKDLSDEDLQRLAFITSTLRRKTSGPPKTAKVKTPGTKGKAKVSLDDALDMF